MHWRESTWAAILGKPALYGCEKLTVKTLGVKQIIHETFVFSVLVFVYCKLEYQTMFLQSSATCGARSEY